MAIFKKVQAVFLSLTIAALVPAIPANAEFQGSAAMPAGSAAPSGSELQQIVAPIALYPDGLVAQVLAGSTYPDQVVEADRWLQQNHNLKGEQLGAAVDKQPWAPSIKALTQFPSVLSNMSTNHSWTSALGDAYFNDPQAVMNEIQTLRHQAKSSGHLESTPQQSVSTQGGDIIIAPSNPEVVYVPQYSPEYVFGYPIAAYPGYSGWGVAAASAISFGAGYAIGAAYGHWGWGWNSWGTNWHGGNVQFNRNNYVSRSNTFVNRGSFNNANINRGTANINRGAANINRGAANINRGTANINRGAANINRGTADINRGAINRSTDQFNRAKPSGGTMNRDFGSQSMSRGFGSTNRSSIGRDSGAFSGFDHGGSARMNSMRGSSSFGGGGFRGGGGGGFRGGGGGRR